MRVKMEGSNTMFTNCIQCSSWACILSRVKYLIATETLQALDLRLQLLVVAIVVMIVARAETARHLQLLLLLLLCGAT